MSDPQTTRPALGQGWGEPWPAEAPDEPVLDAECRTKIDHLLTRYPTKRAVLLPALHIAQRRCGGWLPDYAIEEVAAYLELPPSDVYGVVTFYDLYHQKPVGRHRIRVCTNLSCQLRGSDEIMQVLAEELGVPEGEVTGDGRCSYVHFECLGSCDTAPMMMVDDTYCENLTPQRVRDILKGLA
ncbi:MAG TPA: NADH-quinone oxidoreductase subunit NuoE [Thermoanaerobaculia bacterium]|nr:NADH-quinone oxidoreductase subunit NuoE [Thermoanaerobaculia bacterium]